MGESLLVMDDGGQLRIMATILKSHVIVHVDLQKPCKEKVGEVG